MQGFLYLSNVHLGCIVCLPVFLVKDDVIVCTYWSTPGQRPQSSMMLYYVNHRKGYGLNYIQGKKTNLKKCVEMVLMLAALLCTVYQEEGLNLNENVKTSFS